MTVLRNANALVRFALELCALAALAYWGFTATEQLLVEWLLGLGAPLAFIILWGLFVSPRASMRLQDPARLLVEVVLFGSAVVALAVAVNVVLAFAFALAVAVNVFIMFATGQRRGGRV